MKSKSGRLVLCGASAYDEKYYWNPLLRIICVLFTQEAGGVFLLVFNEDGELDMETFADVEDITYDTVSAGLLTGTIRRRRAEVFRMMELYYRICVLHENAAQVLTEEDG